MNKIALKKAALDKKNISKEEKYQWNSKQLNSNRQWNIVIMKAITHEIGDIYSVYQGIPILFNVIKTKR